jgi:flagellar protein FliO/FliZ
MNFFEYFQFLFALLFVIGLIVTIALIARKFGFGFPYSALKHGKGKRLSISEVTPIDGRRRLVLVKCDEKEHLLLLGPTSETVISTNIVASNSQSPQE